jgi:hypothetical protein
MKVIGFMAVKDEAILLPEVLPHVRPLVDDLLVFDDYSIDGTWDLVKNETYAFRQPSPRITIGTGGRSHYKHLLDIARKNYDYNKEEVWACITEGDMFFLNKTPRQAIEEAIEGGFTALEAIQIDFRRHRNDFWTEENDTFPNYNPSLREQCRWCFVDEGNVRCFKITDKLVYEKEHKYPWPGNRGPTQFSGTYEKRTVSKEQMFMEHHRGSPNCLKWRIQNRSRKQSSKHTWDFTSYDNLLKNYLLWYGGTDLILWEGVQTLDALIRQHNAKPF